MLINKPSKGHIWGLALSVTLFILAGMSINEIIGTDNLWGFIFLIFGTTMWLYLGSGVFLMVLKETINDILESHKRHS